MRIDYASLSDRGQIRPKNEDAFGAFVPEDADALDSRGAVFVVADGMGGHRGGETASSLAIEAVRVGYESHDGSDIASLLLDAFTDANTRILSKSISDTSLFGMGTTCTAMVLVAGKAWFAHVGDSRAYLYRDDEIKQITQDHSLVGDMVRSGIITDEDARNHPKRNIITRSLGIQDAVSTDTPNSPMTISVDDTFVLCSDGLTGCVNEEEIARVIASVIDPAQACETLVAMANDRGGRDNITVQVIRILET